MEEKDIQSCENIIAPEEAPVIELTGVGMQFYMQTERVDSLKEFFVRLIKGKIKRTKKAILENISFSVKKGESVGLIGHNGAGKTTILKIITGIIQPTKGELTVNGTIAPLLNLGAGFDYEATARENIYLNGVILGYTKKEIKEKFDSIIKFAELEEYVDVPLKNFSSGMVARLGFAIAIYVEPDILLVDEILAVGDENFRRKCTQKIEELQSKGVTFIIVSHNMTQIKKLCQNTVWIENGKVVKYGPSIEICDQYQEYSKTQK